MLSIVFPLVSGSSATVMVSVLSHWVPCTEQSTHLYLVGCAAPLEVALTPAGIEQQIQKGFEAMRRASMSAPPPIFGVGPSGRVH